MAFKAVWDQIGEKKFETGVDRGMLYPIVNGAYPRGVVWNGFTNVNESPEGGDAQDFYADNIKYGSLRGAENFGGTVECYTYPDEWKECDGRRSLLPGVTVAQQNRKAFGLSYRSLIGNDTDLLEHGYKIHLIYNASASPSEVSRSTVNESPEAGSLSYEFKTTPVPITVVDGLKATAHLEIDSTLVTAAQLTAIENILYGQAGTITYTKKTTVTGDSPKNLKLYERSGSAGAYVYTLTTDTTVASGKDYYEKTETGAVEPRLPLPDEVFTILSAAN